MSYNNGGGGGHALDPELQARLDEARAMSASFTRAGNKSRPGQGKGQGRGGGGGRSLPFHSGPHRPPVSHGNRGSHFSSASLRSPAPTTNHGPRPNVQSARFGGTGFGAGSHPTINPPVFKAVSPPKALPSVAFDGVSSPSNVVVDTTFRGGDSSGHPAMTGPHFAGPLNSVAPGDPHTGFKAPVVKVTARSNPNPAESRVQAVENATTTSHFNGQHARHAPYVASLAGRELIVTNLEGLVEEKPPTPASIPQHTQAAPAASMDGRQLIVTNWTEDVEKKPWIPAHLQQTSAFQAIQEIADMINQPVEAITMDGCSIPRPRPGARPLIAPFYPPAIVPTPRQPDVDPATWFMTAKSNANTETNAPSFGKQVNPQQQQQNAFDSAMDIDMNEGDGINTQLGGDRVWSAPATHAAPAPRMANSTPAVHTGPATESSGTKHRPQDLSGSIWADAPWKLPNKKENERSSSNKFDSRPKQSGFTNQSTTVPVNSSGGDRGFTFGASAAPSFTASSGSGSAPQVSVGGVSAQIPPPAKKTKNLNDSIWA